MISKRKLIEAIERIDKLVIDCQVGAMDILAHRLIGEAFALRFALGKSKEENTSECEALKRRSPYWLAKFLALHEREESKRDPRYHRSARAS